MRQIDHYPKTIRCLHHFGSELGQATEMCSAGIDVGHRFHSVVSLVHWLQNAQPALMRLVNAFDVALKKLSAFGRLDDDRLSPGVSGFQVAERQRALHFGCRQQAVLEIESFMEM